MKYIKMILKIFRFSLPIGNIKTIITTDFTINTSKLMYWFSFGLFIWCLIIDVITPFTMPYSFWSTMLFVFVSVLYTVFLWVLMKYKTFNYIWFLYSLITMAYLIWHLPADLIQPKLWFWKHVYGAIDVAIAIHTGFYNVIGVCAVIRRIIFVLKD